MHKRLSLLAALAVAAAVLLPAPVAHAEDVYEFVLRKQEKKQQSKWSIADWIETRDRMRLMDLWLAIHSPSPYEFYFGGEYRMFNAADGDRTTGWNAHVAGYASIFGLEFQYNRVTPEQQYWQALLLLRVFGFQAQGTNITLSTGLRNNLAGDVWRSPLFGVNMTIYLAKSFGIEGSFLDRFTSTPNSSGSSFGGTDFGVGAFIEFKFVRLYGRYEWINDDVTGATTSESQSKQITLGTRIFF